MENGTIVARTDDAIPRVEDFVEPSFWCDLAPALNISRSRGESVGWDDRKAQTALRKLDAEGYGHLHGQLHAPFGPMSQVIAQLTSHDLPAVCAFVYDELWHLASAVTGIVSTLLRGDVLLLPAFWAWHVNHGHAGWRPHRDRKANSLFENGQPKSLSVWIPITPAWPANGCMYLLPKDRDRHYGVDDNTLELTPTMLADVVALPAKPGDVLYWTQHIFHWGGRSGHHHSLRPRMNVAFEFQRRDVPAFGRPLLDPAKPPSFEERLGLIAQQIQQYHHMHGCPSAFMAIAKLFSDQPVPADCRS